MKQKKNPTDLASLRRPAEGVRRGPPPRPNPGITPAELDGAGWCAPAELLKAAALHCGWLARRRRGPPGGGRRAPSPLRFCQEKRLEELDRPSVRGTLPSVRSLPKG
jgi:hypothetical protein